MDADSPTPTRRKAANLKAVAAVIVAFVLFFGWLKGSMNSTAGATSGAPFFERPARLTGGFTQMCPDLPTLRRYVEENNERFGGERCVMISPENIRSAVLVEQKGSYAHIRTTTKYDEHDEGWIKSNHLQ